MSYFDLTFCTSLCFPEVPQFIKKLNPVFIEQF